MRDEITKENRKQRELHTLQSFTHVQAFLLTALEQSLGIFPRWIWTQTNEDIANISHGYQLLQASKFILTTFEDNCTQKKQQKTNLERTYWIRHIVHIFQSFANQTGYLQFKWCESQTKQNALAEINLNNWTKPTARFCDGLGFDWLNIVRSGSLNIFDHYHAVCEKFKYIQQVLYVFFKFSSSFVSPWRIPVSLFSPFDNKSNSNMNKFTLNSINHAHIERVFYHKKEVHLQFDREISSLFWPQSVVNSTLIGAFMKLTVGWENDVVGSKLSVKKIMFGCS